MEFMVLDWRFRLLSEIEENGTNKCIYDFCFLVGKHREPQSVNAKFFLPIIPISVVAYAFTLLWDTFRRNSCTRCVLVAESFFRCLAHTFLSSVCYAAKVMEFIQTWIISPLCSLHRCTVLVVEMIIRFAGRPISEWYVWLINPLKYVFLINIVETYPQKRVRRELSVEKLVFLGAVNRREAAVQIFACFLCAVPRFRILKLYKTGMIKLEPSSGTGDCSKKKKGLNYAALEVNIFPF